jgi:glycosyltransferase involved in cell wall biosynthesis
MMPDEKTIRDRTAVVIPAYNAAAHIRGVFEETARYISADRIIIVDDGSSDATWKLASELCPNCIRHCENMGKGAALIVGIRKAMETGIDFVITLDADGQHNPSQIPLFIEAEAKTGADIIIGNRMHDISGMPKLRVFTNTTTSRFISWRCGMKIPDSQSGYRLLKTELFRHLEFVTSRYDLESELLIKAGRLGAKIVSIPIETIYSTERSSINPLVDTFRFLRLVMRSFFW